MRLIFLLLISYHFFLVTGEAFASPSDYEKYFKIDLESPLPSAVELRKKYVMDNPSHDRKYEHNFLIGESFDKIFKQTIKTYGVGEKRLKTANEDELIEMLNSVPKETWQYIGPYLHTVAGISDKVLNMPGIKETKNKFPTRIAPQLADLPNLEFLSPHMYFILMPEIWPENYQSVEIVQKPVKIYNTKTTYDPDLFNKLEKIIPTEEFTNPNSSGKKTKDDLRTVDITPGSLLTSGDVKAFVGTLSNVNNFASKGRYENLLKIAEAGSLLDVYEASQGTALPINNLKDVVNPCQREVQKIIVAGMYDEFMAVVGKDGFSPETWAVTCDKTIKAYRVASMPLDALISLKNYKNGIYNDYIYNLNLKNQSLQFATLQSIIEMYKAPLADVLAIRKNIKPLKEELLKSSNMILSSPISN